MFKPEKSNDTELSIRCSAIQFRPSSEARKTLRPFRRLCRMNIQERSKNIQKNSLLKQGMRRPYRPSSNALGLIRSFIYQPEKCDSTGFNIKISTTRFRLSSEAMQLIRPFNFQ